MTTLCEDGLTVTGERLVIATGNKGTKLPGAPWRYDGWRSTAVPDIRAQAARLAKKYCRKTPRQDERSHGSAVEWAHGHITTSLHSLLDI